METNSILHTRRKGEYVTPSGIAVNLQSLIGKWQKELTQSNDVKRKGAFDEMLLDCLTSIGRKSKSELTSKDVIKIFREDRKGLLFEIRQISNKRNPKFTFDYEFPTKDGKKYKDTYEVDFTPEDFPVKPYKWVADKMMVLYAIKEGILVVDDAEGINELPAGITLTKEQEKIALSGPFPVMYDNYDDIIANHKTQKCILPESGIEVQWDILDGEAEKKFQGILTSDSVSSHTQIQVRSAKYKNETESSVLLQLPLDNMDTLDIEGLRGHIMDVEANVETSVVVQYKDNSNMQANVDLVTTAAFFFPSLAI